MKTSNMARVLAAMRTTKTGGVPATCDCGKCKKCRKRAVQRKWRAKRQSVSN